MESTPIELVASVVFAIAVAHTFLTKYFERMAHVYPATVWLNPVPEKQWGYSQSTKVIKELIGGNMFPLTLEGLDGAMRELTRKKH